MHVTATLPSKNVLPKWYRMASIRVAIRSTKNIGCQCCSEALILVNPSGESRPRCPTFVQVSILQPDGSVARFSAGLHRSQPGRVITRSSSRRSLVKIYLGRLLRLGSIFAAGKFWYRPGKKASHTSSFSSPGVFGAEPTPTLLVAPSTTGSTDSRHHVRKCTAARRTTFGMLFLFT